MASPRLRSGSVRMTFVERDGSTSDLELTGYTDLLLELGDLQPRSAAEREAATATLGEVSCSDETVFVRDDVVVDAETCLGLIGEGLYQVLRDAVAIHKGRGGGVFTAELVDQVETGKSYLNVPDAFWEMGCVAEGERFDLIALGDGALLLRACPYSEADFKAVQGGEFHADDPDFTDGSHCGLTKWACAGGCGAASIVESEEDFPEGWLEVSARKSTGDVIAFEAVCSIECLGRLAATKDLAGLRELRIPGFGAGE